MEIDNRAGGTPVASRTRNRGALASAAARNGEVVSQPAGNLPNNRTSRGRPATSRILANAPAAHLPQTSKQSAAIGRPEKGQSNEELSGMKLTHTATYSRTHADFLSVSDNMDVSVMPKDSVTRSQSKKMKRARAESDASGMLNPESSTPVPTRKKAKTPSVSERVSTKPRSPIESEAASASILPSDRPKKLVQVVLQRTVSTVPHTDTVFPPENDDPSGEESNSDDDRSNLDYSEDDQPEPRDEGDLSNIAHEAVSFTKVIPILSVKSSKKSRRALKLAEEIPKISAGKPLRGHASSGPPRSMSPGDDASGKSDTDNSSNQQWLPHTDISGALTQPSSNIYSVFLRRCTPAIKNVLHASFDRGKRIIAMGDDIVYADIKAIETIPTPFGMRGMEQIALRALITAADNLGYDGQHDIADRLEHGSEELYIAPMRYYTAQRLRPYRADIKKAAASAYPSAVGLSTLSVDAAQRLYTASNFLYPQSANGTFQYAKPFYGPGLADVVRAAFFGDTKLYQIGFQHLNSFTSSLPSALHEVEIPASMLAMAATAVNSVLLDHIQSSVGATTNSNEFAGTALENTFKSYMTILVKLRISSVQKYHALLHKICMSATGGRAVNLHGSATQNDILANVDWSAITSDDS
ncbi:hypothetical protein BC628DRAFT_489318 [Trametes gibbosa]|nr:hypothetical protein BC628DRAFT_489318 [Trametes gibbosa]